MVNKIEITFIQNNEKITVEAMEGQSILDLAHENGLDLEGQCEGSLACSTCHVILEDKLVYDALPKASEDEEDMLDMANGLTTTSRLGCQIIVNKSLNGAVFKIPNK